MSNATTAAMTSTHTGGRFAARLSHLNGTISTSGSWRKWAASSPTGSARGYEPAGAVMVAKPVVYEASLPRPAAGILRPQPYRPRRHGRLLVWSRE